MLQVLKLFLASRNAAIKEVHFPAELGPSFVYTTPEADQRSGQPVPRRSKPAAARAARSKTAKKRSGKAKKKGGKKGQRQEEAASREAASSKLEAARQRRTGAGRAKRANSRRKIAARKVGARLPRLLPDPAALGRLLRRKQQLRTRPGSARLPPQGHRRRAPRRLPDGRRAANSTDGTHYFGIQGIQGWSDPPILDNPSRDQDDPRPRIRDLSSTATGSR